MESRCNCWKRKIALSAVFVRLCLRWLFILFLSSTIMILQVSQAATSTRFNLNSSLWCAVLGRGCIDFRLESKVNKRATNTINEATLPCDTTESKVSAVDIPHKLVQSLATLHPGLHHVLEQLEDLRALPVCRWSSNARAAETMPALPISRTWRWGTRTGAAG